MATADFARERSLLEKLEFRIAAADTSEKLQNILQKFLAPLLQKLASEDSSNRNYTIKVCQYINGRLKIDNSIQLPVEALSKTFSESSNAFVKQFSLLFLQQGLLRLPHQDAITVLPGVLRSAIQVAEDPNSRRILTIGIDFLLGVLGHWRPPEKGGVDDMALKDKFQLSSLQIRAIAEHLSSFLLYNPKINSAVPEDMRTVFNNHFLNRAKIAPNTANLIFTSLFTDAEKFIPATILSVDANESANARADVMFKQCNFDLESPELVTAAFNLYAVAGLRLQTRVLTLLSKSKASTLQTGRISDIVEAQLQNPATSLEASKLRNAMFSYLIWVARSNPQTSEIAPRLVMSLKDFIESQGWPTAPSLSLPEIELRARAYENIGLLCGLINDDSNDSLNGLDIVYWLFTSLHCDMSKDVFHSISESLNQSLRLLVKFGNEADCTKFKEYLIWSIMAKVGEEDPIYRMSIGRLVPHAAVKCSHSVLPFIDVEARLIDILALTSSTKVVAEEGLRGLEFSWHAANARITGLARAEHLALPTFSDFGEGLFSDGPLAIDQNAVMATVPALNGIVSFCRNLIAAHAWHGTAFGFEPNTDWESKIDANLENDAKARSLFKEGLNANAKEIIARLLSCCYKGMALGSIDCGRIGFQLTSLTKDVVLQDFDLHAAKRSLASASEKSPLRITACRISGILESRLSTDILETISEQLSTVNYERAAGQDLFIFETLLLKSSCVLSRAALRTELHTTHRTSENNQPTQLVVLNMCRDILSKSTDKSLRQTAYRSIGQVSLCCQPLRMDTYDKVVDFMLADAKKENEVSVASMGRFISSIWSYMAEQEQKDLLSKVYELHEVRKAEFHFALGEAIAVAALKFRSSSTLTELDVDLDEVPEYHRPELFEELLSNILEKAKTTKPALRKATGIWLLSLVQYCTIDHLLKPRLREIQAAFSRLLTDRDEIVQETGSRGLGIVYEKGDKNLRDDLVRDLVQSFTGNNAKTAGTVNEETQLFEPGALPTENGQSVTTYKDIVSLAQEMGDPSLVYRFMNLASNNAIWTSRAAFGRFGLSGVLADSAYLKDNRKFYPKLFRYKFDPNPNVQRSMNDIWKALVKDSNATIDDNFDLIMQDLLRSVVSGKEWRTREASCAAIADLVQGREVEKLERYLDEIWNVAFKVLDDIKESVRLAAMKLCRTLTNMLLRNLEIGEGTTKRATTMLGHAMPFLLLQMNAGAAKEVQQYAIGTLLDIVKKAPPKSLQSYAPIVLETLINSLSSLEHESINYLHLNADKYGLTAEKLDTMRVSSIGASPVTEAIEKCLDSLTATQATSNGPDDMQGVEGPLLAFDNAMHKLEACFKSTIGLPSRVGLSRVMITLVVRHHATFRPYADRFARLTRKNILDRNATISQSFSTALGYLLRLASEKEVSQTLEYVEKLYFDSQEVSHRAVAGEIVQATSKASNDLFMNFASTFLSLAFIGRHDLDEDTRERFDSAWKENVGGSRALHLYLKEIVQLTSKHIKSSLWPIRHACCFAVADLVSSMESGQAYSKHDASLLWPLLNEALSGKTWDGKDKVISSLPTFVERAPSIWPETTPEIKKVAIREAKRKNVNYRPHALHALAKFARARLDLNLSAEVVPYLGEVVEELLSDSDAMDVDDASTRNASDRSRNEALLDESLSSTITCLFAVLRREPTSDVLDQSLQVVEKVHAQISSTVRLSLYEAARHFIEEVIDRKENVASEQDVKSTLGPILTGHESKFLHAVVLAIFYAPLEAADTESSEALRLARTQLASKIAAQAIPINLETRKTLDMVFRKWLENERSRPIRVLIERASEMNSAASNQ